MDFEKFTEKAQSAIVDCQNYAISEGHQQLEGEHLHLALVRQDQGLIGRLMDYMGVPKEDVVTELENELAKLPTVQGGQLYASQRFNRLLMDAEKKAREFKDEFVSVEHLYLALLDEKNTPSAMSNCGTKDSDFLSAQRKRNTASVMAHTATAIYSQRDVSAFASFTLFFVPMSGQSTIPARFSASDS